MRIDAVTNLQALLRYLDEELDWPVGSMAIEQVTFRFDPAEDLDLGARACASIDAVYQLRSLTVDQPFGIFFIEFSASYLPLAVLRRLLQALASRRQAERNPVDRRTWNAEDLLFIAASGGQQRRRIDLAHFKAKRPKTAPVLHTLGWDPVEPPDKLLWLDNQLRAHLRWPSAPDQRQWRSQWLAAFEQRPHSRRTAWRDLDEPARVAIASLYAATDLTVDALPYTRDFDWMLSAFNEHTGASLSPHEFWRALSSARKTGQLVRKER